MIAIKDLELEQIPFILDSLGKLQALPIGSHCAFHTDIALGIEAKPGKINPDDEDRDFRVTSMTIGTQPITDRAILRYVYDTLWDHYEDRISGHIEEELAEVMHRLL